MLQSNKIFHKNFPIVSIITIVKNDSENLERTIKSVIAQTYNNIEYIIIDGGSTDNTIKIIQRYEKNIFNWISEPDNGIYDAMNKGIKIAKGKWIVFLNAGDIFYKKNTLEKVFLGNYYSTDFIYGDCKIVYNYGFSRVNKAGDIKELWKGMIFSHQSLFTHNEVFKKNKFNIENKIGGDFEFIYQCYLNRYKFHYLGFPVAEVLAGGLSDVKRIRSVISWWSTVNKYSMNIKINIYYLNLFCKTLIKVCMKSILPKKIYIFLLKRKYNIN